MRFFLCSLLVWVVSSEKPKTPSFQIGVGMKFVWIVPHANMHWLTESDFWYNAVLSRWQQWRPSASHGCICSGIRHLPSSLPSACNIIKRLKVATFIYRHLQGNPDPQRFRMWSGVLTDNDTRWHSASSSSPLPKWTDFGPRSLQPDRPNYAPASRTMAFNPQCSPATTHYF